MTVMERFGTNIGLNGETGLEFHDSYTTATYRMGKNGIITLGGDSTGISYRAFLDFTIDMEFPSSAGIMVFVAP